MGLASPTALSMSDKGFLLAAFSCGSICIFDKDYTNPLTVWYHTTDFPISQIKWCKLFFDDSDIKEEEKMVKAPTGEQGYSSNRICEFFAIDQNECFQIWNLQQFKKKPAKTINFSEKHVSDADNKIFRISNTCPD